MQQGKVQVETVQFLAEDGYTLTGKLYRSEYAKANIVIACATGVPKLLPALCRLCSTCRFSGTDF